MVRTPQMFITGLGVHVPPTVSVESAVARGLYPAERADPEGLTGAAVAGDMPAPEMALRAAREAFDRAGTSPTDVDLLLYATTWPHGPEGWLPPSYLQDHLVGGDVLSLEIKQGCNGMFGALEVGASYLAADRDRRTALLVAADNYGTPLMDRWGTGGPFIPGDAASAVVLSKDRGFAQLLSVKSISAPAVDTDLTMLGEPLFPPAITAGREVDFTRGGAKTQGPVFQAALVERTTNAREKLIEVVETSLSEAGISISDVSRTAVVNVDRGFIEGRGMTALGLDIAKSTWGYGRDIGHCGASDPLLGFRHLVSTGQLGPGDHLLMVATGPSITASCAVIKILDTPDETD